jgi:hypothetical protein
LQKFSQADESAAAGAPLNCDAVNERASSLPCPATAGRGAVRNVARAREPVAFLRLHTVMPLARIASCVLLLGSGTCGAEIYACAGPHRMTVYQNFPCEFTSLGAASGTAPVAGVQAPSSRPGDGAHPTAVAAMPRVGMTIEQVKEIWGQPIDTTKEEYAKGDIETWTYADSRSIRFDPKGRVAEIKR